MGTPSPAVECSINANKKNPTLNQGDTYCVIATLHRPSLILGYCRRAYYLTCFPRHVSLMGFEEGDRLLRPGVIGSWWMYAEKHTFARVVRAITIMVIRY